MPSNQNGIFVPIDMPQNCFFCPMMRERHTGLECVVDHVIFKYPDPRKPFKRPNGCPIKIVTNGIVDNMKGEK